MKITEELNNPPKKYRPVPFWSWNDKLEPEEISRQVAEMDKAGLGGYFMHARGGLKTEYMSEQWLDAVRTGITEGEKRGMNPWLYDENGWPSGFADGAVNSLGINYQQKYLRMEKGSEGEISPGDNTIAVIPSASSADGEVYHFYYDVNPFYVDTLNGTVTDEFIRVCHEEPYLSLINTFAGSFRGRSIGEKTDSISSPGGKNIISSMITCRASAIFSQKGR